MTTIFVFGSNLAGRHGAGSALHAYRHYSARKGVGNGPTGLAYAIPTKDVDLTRLTLSEIKKYVEEFIVYAKLKIDLKFEVVKIGCGLAGYNEADIKPMFKDAPLNCILPKGWR